MRKVYAIAFLALLHLCSIESLAYGQFATSPPPGFLPNNPLPIPDTIHGPVYDLHMVDAVHSFWPGQTPVHTMAYQHPGNLTNSYLGPTLMWYRGTNITANITNHTTDTSTNHWHGAHIPAYTDGGPHQPIPPSPDPNSVWSPSFAILDSSATQWYHPHLHHHTFMQVQMGMAGMVFVRDPQDPYNGQLPNDYGVDEFPIIIQDRNFYTPVGENYQIDTNCSVGNIFLVNGTLRPTVTLPAQIVKFRVLSAGSERSFNVGLVDGGFNSINSYQIGTDAGYLAAPLPTQTTLLGVGERAELLLDLNGREGDTLYFANFAGLIPSDFPGGPALNNPPCYGPITQTGPSPDPNNYSGIWDSTTYNLLRIVVGPATSGAITSIPLNFSQYQLAIPTAPSDVVRRNKKLTNWGGTAEAPPPFQIDNEPYRIDHINDVIRLGAVEYWSFKNQTGTTHPMHIHDVHFFITEIRDTLTGLTVPIPPYLQGPKDVMMARSGYKYTFITQFLDFGINSYSADSTYMYHCHILPHEDGVLPTPGATSFNGGMMHQFAVIDSNFYDNTFVAAAEPIQALAWSTFPNPVSDQIYLRGECRKASTLQVISLEGKELGNYAIPPIKGEISLQLGNLSQGMYMLVWRRPDGVGTKRIIVD